MASLTLSKLTYYTACALDIVTDCVASAGSTVSATDATNLTQDADYWIYGTIWVTYDAGGNGAAPEWENAVITDFASGACTFGTLTAAVAAGDRFAVAKRRFPYAILRQKVNQALRELGSIEVTDTTSVTIASSQTEYSLPDVAGLNLREVWIQGRTDDANANEWRRLDGWYVQKSATGTANLLMLPIQYATAYDLKLVYAGYHAELNTATAEIDDSINQNLLIYKAAVDCLEWRIAKSGDDEGLLQNKRNALVNLLEEAKIKSPIQMPSKKPKLLIPLGQYETDTFKTVDDLGNV